MSSSPTASRPRRGADPLSSTGRALLAALVLGLLLAIVTLALEGLGELGWRALTRRTARLALPFFLAAFVAGPLARLWPRRATRALLARRRGVGVAFATILAIHGLAILRLSRLDGWDRSLDAETLVGGLGFLLAFAMAATSNDAAVQRLGRRRWRALHRVGLGLLFVIFAASYGGRFAESPSTWWPAAVALLGALGLRIAATLQSRSLRSRTLPTE